MNRPFFRPVASRPAGPPTAIVEGGLSAAIDAVAQRAAPAHAFLRRQWFAAALHAYGGQARTITVSQGGDPMLALPIVPIGPRRLAAAAIPGCYWPFRSAPVACDADADAFAVLLRTLGQAVRALRIGPVYDGDPLIEGLRVAAAAAGWTAIDRFVADSYLLDIDAVRAEGAWPRASTAKKNRFHEKHLATHGALDWSFIDGAGWDEAAFDALAGIEARSWIAQRTDGSDAKFTRTGHGAFWRMAARDPHIAAMFHAALLRVDGVPAAFSFDIDAGALKYAVANSYDPRFAKHSPGKLLYYRNLLHGIDRGIRRVDWGAGDSGYKRVIGAEKGPAIRDWLFLRPGIPALAGRLLRGAWARSGNRPAPGDQTRM